jgi:ADP-heptose:LPS heptosyltransferase
VALTATPRILVLRALGLGDFLTGVPALRALRRARPDHELVLAAPATLAPLADLAGVCDRLADVSGLAPVPWSGPAPDLAVNLHGRGPQSHRLLRSLEPRALVAFRSEEAPHTGPAWLEEEHETRRWCRLLEETLHIPTDPLDLGLGRPAAPPPAPGAVVIHPGAAYPSRRWPAERFAGVARAVVRAGYDVVLTGGPDETTLADQVAELAGLPRRAVLAGHTGIDRLAAQVAAARLVVCGDTGVAHLASAFRTPSVVLFGPVSPSRWGPPHDGPHVVVWCGQDQAPGDPWGDTVDPALLRVEVADVVNRALELLEGNLSAPGPVRRTTPGSA